MDHPGRGAPGDGRNAEARDLRQDILDRSRRVLGEDHPSTLDSANQLVNDLRFVGEVQAARDLAQDTLDRSRRVWARTTPTL